MKTPQPMRIFALFLLITTLLWMAPARRTVQAQSGSAADLINTVNALRSAHGLAPYDTDGGLMAEAQAQSDYQASIQTCTHQRADGSGPSAHGISAENVACGANLSVQDAINYQWTDAIHNATMLGPDTGQVGAGMTSANGSVYYTLAVRRLTGEFVSRAAALQPAADSPNQQDPTTIPPVVSGNIVVSTPNPDGSISHLIQYGETLIEIANAYDIPLQDLISINHLDPQKPSYFAGQSLLLRVAFTLTPFMTSTFTPRPPTRTPAPTRTSRPTRTPAPPTAVVPTHTPTHAPLITLPTLDALGPMRDTMAYVLIGISLIGLGILALSSLRLGKK